MTITLPRRQERRQPVYREIADAIAREIQTGRLKPGERLPAARELAAELKLNPNTIQHAYRTLKQEGVVETRRGLGMFVAAIPPRDARQKPAVVARQIAERALREAFRHGLLGSDLRKALDEISPKG